MQKTPGLIWAQREDCLFLTVTEAETTDLKYNIEDGQHLHVSFVGRDSVEFVLDLDLREKVDPAASRIKTNRHIEFKLMKVEPGFWNKLYDGPTLRHVGIDWSKWVDPDESDSEGGGNSFNWGDGDAMNIPQFQKGDVNEDDAMEQMLAKMQAEQGGIPDDDEDDIDDIEDLDDLPDVADMPGLVDDQ